MIHTSRKSLRQPFERWAGPIQEESGSGCRQSLLGPQTECSLVWSCIHLHQQDLVSLDKNRERVSLPMVTSVDSSTSDVSCLKAVWTNLGRLNPLKKKVRRGYENKMNN